MDRASEKQAARERDLARLKAGDVSPEELRRENSAFGSLPLHLFKITHIGKRKLRDVA